ncbi:MAG TPA: hypothetical protein DCS17_04585 [Flavobacterium sp.]|nr:hypothetical protein [Flavobacterium sp.]
MYNQKHKTLILQEKLNVAELPDKIRLRIEKFESIINSNAAVYKNKFKDNELTSKAITDLNDLDEVIVDYIYAYLSEKEEEKVEIIEPIIIPAADPEPIIPSERKRVNTVGLFRR